MGTYLKVERGTKGMADKVLDNNQVCIIGVVDSEFIYSHEVYGEGFYMVDVLVNRLSHMADRIPLMVSERLVDIHESYMGQTIEAHGQFRSYNKHENGRNRLVLSVFVREFSVLEAVEESEAMKPNTVFLDGFICKQPVYRMTPLGREIADLLLAVNRPYGKSDYLPCICWGRNARFAGKFQVGEHIRLWGRIQSRTYQKRLDEEQVEKRTAYEISVSKIECVEES